MRCAKGSRAAAAKTQESITKRTVCRSETYPIRAAR